MIARITSATVLGISAIPVDVEVDIARGLYVFSVVGLPASSVSEARTRVRSALNNTGYGFPPGRVTVNLAPGDLRKEGTAFDLPIALAILIAQGQLKPSALNTTVFVGELALDGRLRSVKGVLPIAMSVEKMGCQRLILPRENLDEAGQVTGITVLGADTLVDVVEHLAAGRPLSDPKPSKVNQSDSMEVMADLSEVQGQAVPRRALEIAAAGGHNLLLSGPPGSGKTLLCRCLPSILPPLGIAQAMESAAIASVAGTGRSIWKHAARRPFRAPHHTISDAGLIGGGRLATPGEVSLAHHGVLFLDELPEFRRSALESLRQPLEGGCVAIARAEYTIEYPARFMLAAAMNPCPCGYMGHPRKQCRCHPSEIDRYRRRISGPLFDRFDLMVHVEPVKLSFLSAHGGHESSKAVALRVYRARQIQAERNHQRQVHLNSHQSVQALLANGNFEGGSIKRFSDICQQLDLTARGFHRCLRVARTIADLENSAVVSKPHLDEALQFRPMSLQRT
ncbi:MAG: YifB family Mg chelatase-like AAA ATPase [Myxococcota bacterium]|nr:YifB family Mg chelatase-like AAA ATPase [Myxococcota bacterium]